MTQPTLRSARLKLVPLNDQHFDLEYQLDTDPAVMRYLGGPAPDRAAVERSHARRMKLGSQRDGLGFWMGFVADRFIGLLMLPPAHGPDQPDDPNIADLGYRLAADAWGYGYGREAANTLLTHAFATMSLRQAIAQTRSDNVRSRSLLESIGMRHVRDFRSAEDSTDGPLDSEYLITHTQWWADHR